MPKKFSEFDQTDLKFHDFVHKEDINRQFSSGKGEHFPECGCVDVSGGMHVFLLV